MCNFFKFKALEKKNTVTHKTEAVMKTLSKLHKRKFIGQLGNEGYVKINV